MRIYIHDFLLDYFGGPQHGDVCCGVSVYFSFQKEIDESAGLNSLPTFVTYAGTPKGVAAYVGGRNAAPVSFFDHLIIMAVFDEKKLFAFIRKHFDGLYGDCADELLFKAIEHFSLDGEFYQREDIFRNLARKR